MSTLALTIHTLAGIPEPDAARPALDRLLEPFLHLGLTVDNGPTVARPDDLDALHAELATRDKGGFSARGSGSFEAKLAWHDIIGVNDIARTGALSVFADTAAIDLDAVVVSMIEAAEMLGAPLATMELTGGPYRVRRNQHRDSFQDGKVGLDRIFDLERGLSGLAWCTFLGQPLVDFVGTDRLRSLPDGVATKRPGGAWVLRLGDDIAAPTDPASIIELLGVDRFFDPTTGALPTQRPTIPERTHLPHRIRRRTDSGEISWEAGSAATTPVASAADPIDTWNAMREAYMEHRAINLQHGFVPQVIVIRGPGGHGERTAIAATPDVAYVVPDVDVLLTTVGEESRLVDRGDLDDALAGHAIVAADHAFSDDGQDHVCGLGHRTDDDNEHFDALRDALTRLGSPIDMADIERVR